MSKMQTTTRSLATVPQKPSPEMLLAGAMAASISPAVAYAAFAAMVAVAEVEQADDGQDGRFSLF
jgi:hypothetical protein